MKSGLFSDNFDNKYCVGPDLSYVLWNKLSHDNEVTDLKESIKSGKFTQEDLDKELDFIMEKFQSGVIIEDECTLCGIIVAIEGTVLEEDLLIQMSKFSIMELGRACRLAKFIVNGRKEDEATT